MLCFTNHTGRDTVCSAQQSALSQQPNCAQEAQSCQQTPRQAHLVYLHVCRRSLLNMQGSLKSVDNRFRDGPGTTCNNGGSGGPGKLCALVHLRPYIVPFHCYSPYRGSATQLKAWTAHAFPELAKRRLWHHAKHDWRRVTTTHLSCVCSVVQVAVR